MIESVDAPNKFMRANISPEEIQKQNLQLVRKIQEMNKERDELTIALKQQNMLLLQIKSENMGLKAKLQNQESSTVSHMEPIPCFRCDGRKTESDMMTPCRRCKGTGVVNTQHEKTMKQIIDYFVKQQLSGRKVFENKEDVINPGLEPIESPKVDKKEKDRAEELIKNPQIISAPIIAQGKQNELKVLFLNENLPKNSTIKPGDPIEKIWTFRNIGNVKIPFDAKLVKMNGFFGPDEIRLNKSVKENENFQIKLSARAPTTGDHYCSSY